MVAHSSLGNAAATCARRGSDRVERNSRRTSLGFRNIYILPTIDGLIFILTLGVLFLIAVNYEIQLIYFLVFATAGGLNAAMILTHRNLHGLNMPLVHAEPGFAGNTVRITVRFQEIDRPRTQLVATARKHRHRFRIVGKQLARQDFRLTPEESHHLVLEVPVDERGEHPLPTISLSTRFPLGLFRGWSIIRTEGSLLVYPEIKGELPLPMEAGDAKDIGSSYRQGEDDFYGVRQYRANDSYNRIAWRLSAARDELVSKVFSATQAEAYDFDFAALPRELTTEEKLSQLTKWIVQAKQQGLDYRLRIEGFENAAIRGSDASSVNLDHYTTKALTALALF